MFSDKFMKRLDFWMNILIVINAVAFGLLTDTSLKAIHPFLEGLCNVSIVVFVIELIIRVVHYKAQFFIGPNKGWNYFDAIIVLLSCIASVPFFASFRIFRIFRVFRQLNILRIIPSAERLKLIIEAILDSLPGVAWTTLLYSIIIYTYALLGTEFFGEQFPDWFGNAWRSLYTLFQCMTLESWSMGISRPVMDAYPAAWIYFVSYVVISAFIILNIVVALVLNSMQEVVERSKVQKRLEEEEAMAADKNADPAVLRQKNLEDTIANIENELTRLKDLVNNPVHTSK